VGVGGVTLTERDGGIMLRSRTIVPYVPLVYMGGGPCHVGVDIVEDLEDMALRCSGNGVKRLYVESSLIKRVVEFTEPKDDVEDRRLVEEVSSKGFGVTLGMARGTRSMKRR
jgi:hypothetical protein